MCVFWFFFHTSILYFKIFVPLVICCIFVHFFTVAEDHVNLGLIYYDLVREWQQVLKMPFGLLGPYPLV